MQYLDTLQQIADDLDRRGLRQQADRIDYYLTKIAQEMGGGDLGGQETPDPEVDFTPQTSDSSQVDERLARTTYLMFQELQELYTSHLDDFDYLGHDNIETIQSGIDHLVNLMRTVLRDKTADYDKKAIENYRQHIKAIATELDRSKRMKITPAKVKIDKFYLYEELEMLVRKLERLYDKGEFPEIAPVVKKARSIRDAFGNVIKQVSEEIANADLIEIS